MGKRIDRATDSQKAVLAELADYLGATPESLIVDSMGMVRDEGRVLTPVGSKLWNICRRAAEAKARPGRGDRSTFD